jgi:hypothetical protein
MVSQSVLVSSPIWGPTPDFCYCQTVAGLLMWDALSDERMHLLFIITAGPCQHSYSLVRVPRDSWPYFTVSDSKLPQLEAQVPIFISPGTGWLSNTPRHWVPFSSPPMILRATVKVFKPISTWALTQAALSHQSSLYSLGLDHRENGMDCIENTLSEPSFTGHCIATAPCLMKSSRVYCAIA